MSIAPFRRMNRTNLNAIVLLIIHSHRARACSEPESPLAEETLHDPPRAGGGLDFRGVL
jgi:hypothetical protein